MKFLAAVIAFACLSAAAVPTLADEAPVPSPKYPGWWTARADTGTIFFYCRVKKICGEGSIVSLHMHDQPAPTKADIRAKYDEPRLPITCRNIGKYESCEYPGAIDKKGRPTHFKQAMFAGLKADFFHDGFLSQRVPAGAGYNFLITIASSATSYQLAKKNYALFRSSIAP